MQLFDWTTAIHHDGSPAFVSNIAPALGESVTLTLRTPLDAPLKAVFLRTEPDGEGHHAPMQISHTDATAHYWTIDFTLSMPRNHYRFKLITDSGIYWYNALGITYSDGPDAGDFKLLADYAAPDWVHDAVFYQIFPDRFYNGDPSLTVAPGAWATASGKPVQVSPWGQRPLPAREGGGVEFFGGDLPGIVQKLDYLQTLGVTGIYLTPIFSSPSNHRYNIDDFYTVDKHLGGNEALVELRSALDVHQMQIMLDVTPNHVSAQNPWFLAAQQNPDSTTADFFTFESRPDEYISWLGVKSLPKLNYQSQRLRDVMYASKNAVLRHWLKSPYRIDGWRLDVANMTARQGATQLAHKIGRGIRRAVKAENPQAYLMGENFFDGTPYLQGDELDAIQNYQGFNKPLLRWLAGHDYQLPAGERLLIPAEAMVAQMDAYRAAVPWVIATQQFNQLGSHDTPRILTLLQDNVSLAKLAAFLLMGYVGVPCIYYGDEIGMEGAGDPDNRRTMIWDADGWKQDIYQHYQQLIRLRKQLPALKRGGYQTVFAQGDLFAFSRHLPTQRLILVAYRGTEPRADVRLPVRHVGVADQTTLIDHLSGAPYTVEAGALALGDLPAGAMLLLEAQ